MALPLMRIATREAEHLQNQTQPKVLTMAEATRWAKDVMRVLSLRSAQCSNRIQIATVGADGVDISAPFEVEGNWEIDGFYSSEKGNLYQPNATVADLHPY
jgi:20S proteasome alpha/beta subunit